MKKRFRLSALGLAFARPRFQSRFRRFLATAGLAFSAVLAGPVAAQTWNGAGVDDFWTTATNWSGGVAPVAGTGTNLIFDGAVRLTPNFDFLAGTQMGSISFATGASAFTLGGNSIKIFSKIENNGAALQTVGFTGDLVLNGPASTQINPVDGDLVINSKIVLDTPQLQVFGGVGKTVTFNGIIADGTPAGGSFALKQNTRAVLKAANAFTGGVFVEAGVLRAESNAAALGSGTLSMSGGELQLANDTGLGFNRNTTLTGNALITSDTLTAVAGVNHTLGTLNMGGQTLSIAKGSNATGSTAGVTFGAVTLTGAPTFSTGAGSNLTLGAITGTDQNLTFTGSGITTVSGVIGTGAGLLNVNGGTVTLSNTGNTFTGAVTVDGAGSLLIVPGNAGAAGDPTALGAGSKAINLTNGGTIRITSGSNPTGTNTKMFTIGAGGGKIDAPTGITITLDDNTGATAQLQGTGDLTKTGAGILQLGYSGQAGANAAGGGFAGYSGNIIVSAGTLQVGNSNGLGSGTGSTTTVLSGGALDFYSGASTIADDLTISGTGPAGNGALLNSTAVVAASNGTLTMAADSSLGASGTGSLTINGVTSGAFNLTKVGTGTGILTLANAANTYTGTTTIAAGTLAGTTIANVGGGDTSFGNVTTAGGGTIALGSVGNAVLRVNATTASTTDRVLDLAGTTFNGGVDSSGTAPVNFTSNITVTGNGIKQFTLSGTNANNNTFSGIIADGGAATGLAKSGTGTWVLPVANSYTGATVLTGGVLSITNGSALGTTANGTTQSLSSELRLSGGITIGAEALSISGGGITNFGALRNFSGNNTWGGAITLAAQSRINSDSGSLTINNTITGTNAGLVVGGGGDLVLNGALSFGNGVLSKADGTGTLSLNAASLHTGATTVGAGKMVLGPGANFTGVTVTTVANGATLAIGQNASGTTNALGAAGASNVTFAAGSKLTMADGFTSTLNIPGTTTFGGTSASSLTFDIGGAATATDRVVSTGNAAISAAGATIGINPIGATPLTPGSYNLITGGAGSTLTTNPFTLSTTKVYVGATPFTLSLANAATTVGLNVATFSGLDTAYWKGDLSSAWNDVSAGSNWDTTEAGGTDASAIPTSVTDVFIHANAPGNLTNTLGQDFTINSLNYTAASTTSTIGSGNTLTLAAAGAGNIGINVASGAAAHTINSNVVLAQNQTWNHAGANSLTMGGGISGTGALTKTGTGTLALTGTYNGHTGGMVVNGGKVSISNSYQTAGGQILLGNTAGNGLLSITGGTVTVARATAAAPGISAGNAAGGAGAINLSNGTLNTPSEIWLGSAAGGYGAMTITGGTANVGSWLTLGRGGNAALNVSGGTLNVLSNHISLGTLGGGSGNTNEVANFSGNSTTNVFGGGIFLPEQQAGHVSVVNISDTAKVFLGNAVAMGSAAAVNTGTLNVNGGTLTTKSIVKGSGTGTYLLNLNGGTVKAQIGATAGFLTGLTAAYVNSGGAIFDTNGQNITVAQPLLAPTGNGVTATGLTLGGTNSGYIDTPVVSITGGGGTGATAVANLDYTTGVVTGITITNPGNGYTSAPDFSLIGGGGAATIGGTATLAANATTGGLTKNGAGVLSLTGANTYTGATVVNGGGISIGNTYATSGFTFAAGTSLGFTNTVNLTIPQNLVLTNAITKNSGTSTSSINTFTGTNSFTGLEIAVNNGTLQFDSAAAFGMTGNRAAVINSNLALNYATPLQQQLLSSVNGLSVGSLSLTSAHDLTQNLDFSAAGGANQTTLHLGALLGQSLTYTGTLTPNAGIYRLGGGGGNLTLPNTNALTGANSLNIHGVGGGSTVLSGTNNYSGGTTFVGNSGALNFANGALGSGNISFSTPTPSLQWASGNTQDISASRTITFNSGSVPSFDTNGNNVVLGSPIGNFGAGGLTKTGTGNLTLTGVNTYTGGTTISAGTLTLANAARLNSTVTISATNGLVLGGTSATIGGLAGASGNSLAAGSTLTIGANNAAATYSGALAATTAGLTKIGAATQTLSGANLYTGATTVNMGNLTTGQLVSSVLNLSFAANQTNRLASTSALVLGGSVATDAQTILGGGNLTLTGIATSTNSQTVPSITIGVGGNNIVLAANATANPLLLTTGATAAASALVRNAGGTLHLTQPTGTLSATNGLVTNTGTAATILTSAAGTAYATIGANAAGAYGWAGKNAGGWLDAASVTYTNSTASTIAGNADIVTAVAVPAVATPTSLRFNNATGFAVTLGANNLTVGTGGILFGSTVNQTITGGGVGTLRSGTGRELVFINTNIGTPQINAVLADSASGASSVTYRALIGATATGQFVVGGTNTYTGPTYITSGRIQTNAVAQPFGTGALAKVYIDGNTNGQWYGTGSASVANPFFITGNGWSEPNGPFGAIRMDNGITLTGGVTLLGDAGIGVNAGTGTISSALTGAFNLTKLGATRLDLTGNNTPFTGRYIAQAGQLVFNDANAYGGATGIVLNGGTVAQNPAGMQAGLINRIVQSTPTTLANGTIGVTAGTVADNVDFSSTGLDLSNVYLGAPAGALTYTGTITPYNNAYKVGGGGASLTFGNTDAFVDNGATPRSLTIRGNTVLLTGTNSYSGGTTLTGGGLNFVSGAIGSGPLTISGGSLTWAAGNSQDITASRAVTFTGASTLDVGTTDVTLASPLAFNTTSVITKGGANTLTLSGASTTNATSPTVTVAAGGLTLGTANALPVYTNVNLTNTAGVVITIAGNQTLGSVSNNAAAFGSAASLVLGAGTTLTVGTNNTTAQTIDAVISGNGNLLKVGTGSQYLRSLNPAFGGALEVNNGFTILELAQVAPASSDVIPASTVVTLSGGGIQVLGNTTAASTSNQTITNAVVLNPGASSVGTLPRASQTTNLILTAGFNRQTGSTVNVLTNGGGSSFIGNGASPVSSITTNQLNADYSAAGGNQSILGGYAGFSSVVPTANTLNPPTTWAVSANSGSNIPIAGLASFSSTFVAAANVDAPLGNVSTGAAALAVNSLRLNGVGATTIDATGGLTIASGGILATAAVAANPVAIVNGTLTSGNGSDLIVHQYATGDMTIGSQITGSIGLTKSGAGRLILTNGGNTYNGGTFVNAGTLRYATSTTPASSTVMVRAGGVIELTDGVTVTGQTATLSGVGLAAGTNAALFGATGSSTWAGNIIIGDPEMRLGAANAATLIVSGNIGDGAASNGIPNNAVIISGSTGTGTVAFSGNNAYTGKTNVLRGILQLGSATALPSTTILDVHSGTTNFVTTADQATVDLNGYSPTVAGLARTDTTGAGIITNFAAATSTLTVNNATANTFSGNIADGLGKVALVKSGVGNIRLAGNNLFSGGLTINAGTVFMGSQNAIGNQAQPNALTMTGGTLDANGFANVNVSSLSGAGGTITDTGLTAGTTTLSTGSSTNETFGGLITNGTVRNLSFNKGGSGTQTLTANNNYTGATVVSAGTLLINGDQSAATGAYIVAPGATLGGSGTIGGALTVNGVFSPGNSPGTMTTSGPVTFGSLSVLNYELNGGNTTIGGGINDLLTGVTNLTLGGTLNVLESPATSFLGATEGNMWRLMNYSGTLNGALALGTTPTLTPGLYLALDTATPNQVNLVVVPETGAVSLLGLATLFTLRRRRNRNVA